MSTVLLAKRVCCASRDRLATAQLCSHPSSYILLSSSQYQTWAGSGFLLQSNHIIMASKDNAAINTPLDGLRRLESNLCDQCEEMIFVLNDKPLPPHTAPSTILYEHRTSITAVHLAAAAGCRLCEKVCAEIPVAPETLFQALTVVIIKARIEERPHFESRQHGIEFEYLWDMEELQTETPIGAHFVCSPIFRADRIGLDSLSVFYPKVNSHCGEYGTTGCDQILAVAARWFQICCTGHSKCGTDQTPGFVPPRLLDLMNSTVRVVNDTSHLNVPYATLSHCWGTTPNLINLTAQNSESLCEGIENLPATFRDAVRICCSLHIQYIWIDSLYIIQAGPKHIEDWQVHVKLMGDIYQNWTINIAAAHEKDSESGCISTRVAAKIAPCLIPLPGFQMDWAVQSLRRSASRLLSSICELRQLRGLDTSVFARFQPSSRGWVTQERLLSPRTIYFAEEQIFWECSETLKACETYSTGIEGSWQIDPAFSQTFLSTKSTAWKNSA